MGVISKGVSELAPLVFKQNSPFCEGVIVSAL